jgi:hypothetical protein
MFSTFQRKGNGPSENPFFKKDGEVHVQKEIIRAIHT